MPSLCTVCGRFYCDHTPQERGQTQEKMMRAATDYELHIHKTHPEGSTEVIKLARRNAHLPVM